MIETALLILSFGFLCAAVVCLQVILSVCHMTLELQERVAVWSTPIVVWMMFGKHHRK